MANMISDEDHKAELLFQAGRAIVRAAQAENDGKPVTIRQIQETCDLLIEVLKTACSQNEEGEAP